MRVRDHHMWRLAAFYAAMFAGTGAGMPYLPVWFSAQGLNSHEIGAILAGGMFARALASPLLASWADGLRHRAASITRLAFGAALMYSFYPFVQGFWAYFIISAVSGALFSAMIPLTESLAVRRALREGVSYGQPRAIGSAAFMAANIICGMMMATYPPLIVVMWVIVAAWAAFGASFLLPYEKNPEISGSYGNRMNAAFKDVLKSPTVILVLLIGALIQSSHGYYYGFSALVWQGQGLSEAMIGRLWAFAILAEILFLIVSRPIGRKVGAKGLILLGGGAAVVRWILLGLGYAGPELYAIQVLHLFTFACTHLGVLVMIDQRANDGAVSLAQTLNSSLSYGLALGLTTLISGKLFADMGPQGYWVMAAIAGAGLALAMFLEPQPINSPDDKSDHHTSSSVIATEGSAVAKSVTDTSADRQSE